MKTLKNTTMSVRQFVKFSGLLILFMSLALLASCADEEGGDRDRGDDDFLEGVCNGVPADTADINWPTEITYNPDVDFTEYEQNALDRLHEQGWNGEGVQIVIHDSFNDGKEHGLKVAALTGYYARNAELFKSARDCNPNDGPCDVPNLEGGFVPFDQRKHEIFEISNHSYGLECPTCNDELVKEQSHIHESPTFRVRVAGNVSICTDLMLCQSSVDAGTVDAGMVLGDDLLERRPTLAHDALNYATANHSHSSPGSLHAKERY